MSETINQTGDNVEKLSDFEAEQAVLGEILMCENTHEDDRVWDICQKQHVVAEMFTDPRHYTIYQCLQTIANNNQPIDATTLQSTLRRNNQLEQAGGSVYIAELVAMSIPAREGHYIYLIKDMYKRREARNIAKTIIEEALDTRDKPYTDAILSKAIGKLMALSVDDVNTVALNTALPSVMANIREQLTNPNFTPQGLPTGFKDVDDILLGLKPKEMIVIGARPSVGKTAMAMNIAEFLAVQKKQPVLVFSLEMDKEALLWRMLSGRAKIDNWKLASHKYAKNACASQEALKRLEASAQAINEAPIYVNESSEIDIMQIRAIARSYKRQNNIQLIVIDYLQLCHYRDFANPHHPHVEVSMISRNIKAMAKELNIPVIVLSQLNRNGSDANHDAEDGTETPKLADFRDSGSIEQDADVAILLHRLAKKDKHGEENPAAKLTTDEMREDPNGAIVCVNIAKHRNGATGKVSLFFNRSCTRFQNHIVAKHL